MQCTHGDLVHTMYTREFDPVDLVHKMYTREFDPVDLVHTMYTRESDPVDLVYTMYTRGPGPVNLLIPCMHLGMIMWTSSTGPGPSHMDQVHMIRSKCIQCTHHDYRTNAPVCQFWSLQCTHLGMIM